MATFEFGAFSDAQINSIADSTARLNLWEGAVRSGKTISSILRWLEYVRTAPANGELLMIGKTERTLERNILHPIADIAGPRNWKYSRGTGEAHLFGRRILISGANDAKAEGKIRGLTLAGWYGDELTLWPAEVFRQAMIRLSVTGAKAFGTTNPDSPFHWLKTEYLDRAAELEIASFHFNLEDNLTLDPAYVAALRREYTGLWFKRFILGLWVMADGTIYDVDPDLYIVSELPAKFDQIRIAVDYGTANPTCYLLFGRAQNRWYVLREYYYDSRATGRQKTDGQYADDFTAFVGQWHPQSIEIDPSAASFIAELRKRGFTVHKAVNDVLDGIRTVGRVLGSELFIHESCRETIGSLSVYSWDAKAQLRGDDKPIKQNDHAADALRYGAIRIFGRRGLPPVALPRAA